MKNKILTTMFIFVVVSMTGLSVGCERASDPGYANLRTGPGTEYEIICQIPDGDNMEVYRKKALSESGTKWQKVTYLTEADNETGYAWLTGWIAESQLE